MKRIDADGRSYRIRRGRLVEIPPAWVGHVTTKQTQRKRRELARSDERRDHLRKTFAAECVAPDPEQITEIAMSVDH